MVALWVAVWDIDKTQAKVDDAVEEEDVPDIFEQAAHVIYSDLNVVHGPKGDVEDVIIEDWAKFHNIGYRWRDIGAEISD